MGQNGSHHDRSSKHRQSTRSLPDASLNRLESDQAQWAAYANAGNHRNKLRENNGVCTKSASGGDYDQNLENFQRNWGKAAAPYYAPSTGKRPNPAGARSFDGNYNRAAGIEPARTDRKFTPRNEEVDDNWSDVASDMYRIKKHSSYQASAPSTKYRDLKITDASDAKSDCSGASKKHHRNRRYRRGASESGAPLSRVPENPLDTQFVYPVADQSVDHSSDVCKRRSKSVQSFRNFDQHHHQPPVVECKPPRPPKKLHYYARLENPANEKWIDYPVRNAKVKFESSTATSPPSSDFSSPKTPTSSECDKLIIQSLRAELGAERSFRAEVENKLKKESKESEYLRRNVESLENQVSLLTKTLRETESKSDAKKALEVEELTFRMKHSEDERIHLEKVNQEQKCAYDRCLDDIADKVTHAVIKQKALQAECDRLQKLVVDLERKNKQLHCQLDTANQANVHSGTRFVSNTPSCIRFPDAIPVQQNKIVPINKWAAIKPAPIFRLNPAAAASCESITSFNDINLLAVQSHIPTTSPITNGGEALCSRPTSFNFDAYSNETMTTPQLNSTAMQSQSDSYSDCSEVPKNFAEIYDMDIDDPFQKSTVRPAARTTTYQPQPYHQRTLSGPQCTNYLPRPQTNDCPTNQLSTPLSPSKSVSGGSNDTLCPTTEHQGDQTPKQTSPKREIIVNMAHSICTDFSRIYHQSPLIGRDKLIPLQTFIADDGYATMSTSALMKLVRNKSSMNSSLLHHCQRGLSLSDHTLQASSLYSTLTRNHSAKKFSLSDSQLTSKMDKNLRTKCLLTKANNFFTSFFISDENYKNFEGLLSSRNDLTEFERDMLLWQENGSTREALCELDDDVQLVFTQQEKENVIEHEVKENTCKPLVSEIEQPACQQNDISNKPNPLVTINNQPDLSVKVSSFKNETKQQKQQKQKPAMNRKDLNDSSTTSSYTSDDSEDDGSAMVEEWLKQLKVKKTDGKAAVVRYIPTDLRPSILRRDVFYRFGKQERKALTCFEFLYRQPSSSCSPETREPVVRTKVRNLNSSRRVFDKRKSGSFSNLPTFKTNDDYENLPYHQLTRTLSADFSDKKSAAYHWRHWASSTSSSLEWSSRRSFGSSLFLSDLGLADRTLSSSSSLSFSNF